MKRFKWIIEVTVAEEWVADGFDFASFNGCKRNEAATERVEALIPYCSGGEITARILSAPPKAEIRKVQS